MPTKCQMRKTFVHQMSSSSLNSSDAVDGRPPASKNVKSGTYGP